MVGTLATAAVMVLAVLLHIILVLDAAPHSDGWGRTAGWGRGDPATAATSRAAQTPMPEATLHATPVASPHAPTPARPPATPVPSPIPPSPSHVVDVGLDPGHSDAEPGALGGGLREADLTLPLAMRVKALLEERGLTVALSRVNGRPLSPLRSADPIQRVREEQEARIAAVGETRIYVSLHFNGHPDRTMRGIETYYNPSNRGEESRRLAAAIQRHLVDVVRSTG
jgi:N-acetylmuramoyl-L-alanine amidase